MVGFNGYLLFLALLIAAGVSCFVFGALTLSIALVIAAIVVFAIWPFDGGR